MRLTCWFFGLIFTMIAVSAQAETYPQNERHYCDTSAGRSILNNGSFSQSYCRYTAVMLLQDSRACCTWAGGVLKEVEGQVICRNGTISPICSIQGIQKYKSNPLNRVH
jgi:hypothetical protein